MNQPAGEDAEADLRPLAGHLSDDFTLLGRAFVPSRDFRPAVVRIVHGRVAELETTPDAPAGRLPDDVYILPGFVDGHTHLLGVGLAPLRPDLSAARSKEEALSAASDWLRDNPGDTPVIAEGCDESTWSAARLPTRVELDRLAPARPLALRRVCGHVAVLNSAALRTVGPDWPDLDAESGLAREALPLSLARLWPPTREQLDAAVELGQRHAWQRGVTSIHEMGHERGLRAFGRAARAGRLRLRVTHFLAAEALEALRGSGLVAGFGNEFLRLGGIKLFLDGSIGGRSAAVREPYPQSGERGLLLIENAKLDGLLEYASREEWPVAMHAIGDRALEQAIQAGERLLARGIRPAAPGLRLEHAEMLDSQLLARAVAAGFLFSMQPNFTARWQNPGELYESALGPERAAALNPYRQVAATGRLHFGSDTMPMDPFLGLLGATSHPCVDQRLSREEALWMYSGGAAAAVANPFGAGTLRPGEPADLCLVQLPKAGESPARGARVLATWVGGVLCHADPALPALLAPSGSTRYDVPAPATGANAHGRP